MLSSFVESLNEKQRQAVEQPLNPVLILAGPGTGKTRMLIARVAWLIQKCLLPPEKILALTFTNKAATELQSRLVKLCGQDGIDVHAGTIHSFALEVLRKYHHKVDLQKNFAVCDKEYQERLLKKLCAPVIREDLDNKVKGILLSFSQWQMREKKLPIFAKDKYIEYTKHLQKHHLIDFNQIIVKCRDLFRDNPDILLEYQHLYEAILVDEFQDTDPVQYEIIKLLALKEKNIFIVADDDQSIYSWRGANPENIRKYIKDFNIEKVCFLEKNYRSGKKIIDSAQNIIVNTDRVEPDKKIKSTTAQNDDIKVYLFLNEGDEIEFIVKKIKDWRDAAIPYSEMAVIYPFHKMGQSVEQYFIREKIPYQMAAGNSFLENPVLQQMILFLRIVLNANDDIALEQLSETELGIPLTKMIKQQSYRQNISFRRALYQFYRMEKGQLEFESILKIKNFVSHIASLTNLKTFFSLGRLIDEIYSIANQNRFSYLSTQSHLLECPPAAEEFHLQLRDINQNKEIYVYHSDNKVAYLAAQIITMVLNTTIKIWQDEQKIKDHSQLILFALEQPIKCTKEIQLIPIFKLRTAKRQGSLSNLFKVLQGLIKNEDERLYENYIILDLETTDKNVDSCGIVEFAAIRIENEKRVDEIQSLINPQKQISKGAQSVHHISDKDVKQAPTINEFWPELKKFIGDSLLIAHNGYSFDFSILDRFAKKIDGKKLPNIRLDSLTMARSLYPDQSNSIDALIDRFKLDAGTRHRALDDVIILHDIIQILQKNHSEKIQKSSLEMYTDIVALGNYLEKKYTATEDQIFFLSGARKLISPYTKVLNQFCDKFNLNKINVISEINSILSKHGTNLSSYNYDENLILKIKILVKDFNDLSIDDAIAHFLSFVNLNSGGQEHLENINAVSLLTFHAVKGLEFEKIILMGLEKNSIPGYHSLREDPDDDRPVAKKVEEQRRLLYVGITRGKNEVLLTAVKNRGGWENESSPFLKELNVPKEFVRN